MSSEVCVQVLPSAAVVSIFTQPWLVGEPLQVLARAASADFVNARLKAVDPASCTVVEILNGGRYYNVPEAMEAVFGAPCPAVHLRAKRYQTSEGEWAVRTWDEAEELDKSLTTLRGPIVIGDTVATGTTLTAVLDLLVTRCERAGNVRDVEVFAIAGSEVAVSKLQAVATRLAGHGKTLTYTVGVSRLHLDDNGTDLTATADNTVASSWEAITTALGDFPPTALKCVVWDWGDRFTKPAHHLTTDILPYYRSLPSSPFRDTVLANAEAALKALPAADAPASPAPPAP